MIERLVAVLLVVAPTLCWAQGNESVTASPSGNGGSGAGKAIQIGAGSTSSVTTGYSGPGASENNTVPPVAPSFSITPEQDTLLGPGMLAIGAPDQLRCDVIADDRARAQCTRRSSERAPSEKATESAND